MIKKELTPFFKNVSILASGTVASQIILFVVSPVLTRLYPPDDFGTFQIFMSISLLTGIFVTGKFEQAIVLPEKTEDARRVAQTTVLLAFIISTIYLIIFQVFRTSFLQIPNIEKNSEWLYLIPINNFLTGCVSCMILWIQRQEKWIKMSVVLIGQAILTSVFNISFAYSDLLHPGFIWAYTLTQLVLAIILIFSESISENLWDWEATKKTIIEYQNFPRYIIWSAFLLTMNQQVIPIIFAFLYSAKIVGFFYLSIRVLRAPVIVMSNAVADVFKNEAIVMYRETGNCQSIYKSTLKRMALLGFFPFLLLLISAPFLFELVFGVDWKISGIYAQALSIMLFFEFISVPFFNLYIITNNTKLNLFAQFVNTIASISGIFLGYFFFNDTYYSILFFSFFNTIVYAANLILTYKLAKNHHFKATILN